jgi:chromosome segregation ATPase
MPRWVGLVGAAVFIVILVAGYYAWKASLGREAALDLERRQAEISNLKSQISKALDRVAARQTRVQELEARRAELERTANELRARLAELHTAEQKQIGRIAALPLPALSSELQRHFGPEAVKLETHNSKLQDGGRVSPSADGFQFRVSEEGGRRIATALEELKGCREQATIKEQQYQNCRASLTDYAALGEQQALQTRDLKQALDAEQRAFEVRDQLAKKEVKAAHGSWLHRLVGKAKWFVVGAAIGVAAGVAAR